MSFENQNGRGVLFDNRDRKYNDTSPDWNGSIKYAEIDYAISAWENPLDNDTDGIYLSLKLRPSVEDVFANDDGITFEELESEQNNSDGYKLQRNTGILFFSPDDSKKHVMLGQVNFAGTVDRVLVYEKTARTGKLFYSLFVPSQVKNQEDNQKQLEQEYVKNQISYLEQRIKQKEDEQNASTIIQNQLATQLANIDINDELDLLNIDLNNQNKQTVTTTWVNQKHVYTDEVKLEHDELVSKDTYATWNALKDMGKWAELNDIVNGRQPTVARQSLSDIVGTVSSVDVQLNVEPKINAVVFTDKESIKEQYGFQEQELDDLTVVSDYVASAYDDKVTIGQSWVFNNGGQDSKDKEKHDMVVAQQGNPIDMLEQLIDEFK